MTLQPQENKKRFCSECGSTTTGIHRWDKRKDGTVIEYPHWFKDGKGGYWCKKCRLNLVDGRKWNSKLKNHVFSYKGKIILLDKPTRIGVCNWCRAVVNEINAQTRMLCRMTEIAHMSYHDDNPLKDTLELCVSCHRKYDKDLRILGLL